MKALGLIETKGLLAAIESADTMLKAADVSIFEKTYVGGGLVSVAVTGDVAAVKAAVEAGVAAVKKLDASLLVSEHVIPRPHEELYSIIGIKNIPTTIEKLDITHGINNSEVNVHDENNMNLITNNDTNTSTEAKESSNEETNVSLPIDIDILPKNDLDDLITKDGIEKAIEVLNKIKLSELRSLARQYEDLEITGKAISKASKKLLITKIIEYYK
ncbi:carbon dioxide concentrating mechanism protein ccmK-like protein [Clostridium sartagoforme AAU1]|uniref:Carbon dioxide concentrating mechanism protein ccmK-like protein n=1 Tax=Clostridium sartagoforme AAU1 TaxID=1202534 RepID=R9CCX9_9CLOT|nr:BMC domain-containing protein [Clostridium sartagoforme]EOR25081.1 carbon dioxide concentrating mechanism protein ccmK-like protein [Clostridium sartagoforme AAU1]